jgi:hypothetical protein
LFDCITEKTNDSFKEDGADAKFPAKCSANQSLGKTPIIFQPMNEAANK